MKKHIKKMFLMLAFVFISTGVLTACTLLPKTVSYIELNSEHAKKEYKIGEVFNKTAVTVFAIYDDESKEDVTSNATFDSSAFKANEVGTYTITVTYKSKSAYYQVKVVKSAVAQTKAFTLTDLYASANAHINLVRESKSFAYFYLTEEKATSPGRDYLDERYEFGTIEFTEEGDVYAGLVEGDEDDNELFLADIYEVKQNSSTADFVQHMSQLVTATGAGANEVFINDFQLNFAKNFFKTGYTYQSLYANYQDTTGEEFWQFDHLGGLNAYFQIHMGIELMGITFVQTAQSDGTIKVEVNQDSVINNPALQQIGLQELNMTLILDATTLQMRTVYFENKGANEEFSAESYKQEGFFLIG